MSRHSDRVVAGGTDFFQSNDPSLVSEDRHTTILPFVMAGEREEAEDNIGEVLDVVDEANGVGGFEVLIAGGASLGDEFQGQGQEDLEKGESFEVPIALLVLVLVFRLAHRRGRTARARIPRHRRRIGVSALSEQAFELSFFVTNVITMMGLAVGIDYSLFLVSRYREEPPRPREGGCYRRHRRDRLAGGVFSGMTVVVALMSMLLIPHHLPQPGCGTIIVVLLSVLIR
jgi:RND superfamily putative drug exporter